MGEAPTSYKEVKSVVVGELSVVSELLAKYVTGLRGDCLVYILTSMIDSQK